MAKQTAVEKTADDRPAWMVEAEDVVGSIDLSDVYKTEDYGSKTISLSQAEQSEALTFEEAMERAGLTEDDAIVGSAFTEAEKQSLVGVPFLIITCGVSRDKMTEREYIVVRALTKETPRRMVVFTDGSTGFFQQMKEHIRQRLNTGQPAWEGYYVKQGLRVSEYPVVDDPQTGRPRPITPGDVAAGLKPSSTGRTYYIA